VLIDRYFIHEEPGKLRVELTQRLTGATERALFEGWLGRVVPSGLGLPRHERRIFGREGVPGHAPTAA
jgi:hypothetical protein